MTQEEREHLKRQREELLARAQRIEKRLSESMEVQGAFYISPRALDLANYGTVRSVSTHNDVDVEFDAVFVSNHQGKILLTLNDDMHLAGVLGLYSLSAAECFLSAVEFAVKELRRTQGKG